VVTKVRCCPYQWLKEAETHRNARSGALSLSSYRSGAPKQVKLNRNGRSRAPNMYIIRRTICVFVCYLLFFCLLSVYCLSIVLHFGCEINYIIIRRSVFAAILQFFTLFIVYICYFGIDCEKQSMSKVNPPRAVV